MSQFRTRLTLNPLDDRLVPSGVTPPDPGAGPPANVASFASPYVTINTTGMAHATQLLVNVTGDDDTVTSVFVNIPAGTDPASAAALIASALQSHGVNATVNGNVVTVWTSGSGAPVTNVDVQVVASDLGQDNPGIQPPTVIGHNGATGRGWVNLPAT